MSNRMRRYLILAVAIIGYWPARSFAQDLPGKKDSLHSTILKEERLIQVVLPDNYKPGSADKYEVVYVLDGESNTRMMSEIQHFLQGEGFMPQVIIVGVMNTDRTRDLTPTHEKDFDTSGGSDKFLSFFETELMPYINKNYPANGDNVLWAHSFGGLFVTYAMLNKPQLFNSYIAADPSYWWGNGQMIRTATNRLPSLSGMNKTIFITGREGQGLKEMGIPPMDSTLKKYAPKDLTWKISAYPDETHGTVRLKSIYDGLRFVYAGYNNKGPEFHPMTGILIKNKPVNLWYFGDSTKVRYTTDGSTPTLSSPMMETMVTMPGPGTFTAKAFSGHAKYDKSTTGVFKEGTALKPAPKIKGYRPGGFHYAYYEGQWDKLPDFTQLKPVKEGVADSSFRLDKLPRKINFGLVFSGQMEVPEDGYYIFAMESDDGSRLLINGQVAIDHDGLHSTGVDKSCVLPLKKGFYPVRLEYFQKDGGSDLRVMYLKPGTQDIRHPKAENIPFNLRYSSN